MIKTVIVVIESRPDADLALVTAMKEFQEQMWAEEDLWGDDDSWDETQSSPVGKTFIQKSVYIDGKIYESDVNFVYTFEVTDE